MELRRENNRAKEAWMGRFWPGRGGLLYDVAAGCGGDMWKWARLPGVPPAEVVAFDLDRENLREFHKRRAEHGAKLQPLQIKLFACSMLDEKWPRTGPCAGRAELVTCNFALHFAFGSVEHLDRVLRHVHDLLRPGACFVGAYIDGTRLLRDARPGPEGRLAFAFGEMEGTAEAEPRDFGQALHARLVGAPSIVGAGGSHEFVLRLPVLAARAEAAGLDLVAWELVRPRDPTDCHALFAFCKRPPPARKRKAAD